MTSAKYDCVKQLLDNPNDIFLQASDILLKFANNVLNHPENTKYRSIRIANATVTEKLLPANGGLDCLFAMGFQEDGEFLRLPTSALLDDMTNIRNEIVNVRHQQTGNGVRTAGATAAPHPVASVAPPTVNQRSEASFYAKLVNSMEHVMIYEDPELQIQARACIPVDRLQKEAQSKHNKLAALKGNELKLEDILLLELLAWFKAEFFKWVDAPNCEFCGSQTTNQGMTQPTAEDLRWGAGRVENYRCNSCGRHTLFPRYNHPGKLLQTRRGRCGEWANCFTLCCRAVGFEARYVLDWTDHVWTEVYSHGLKRWLHCDPCENTCDKPLVYEAGWGKKLSYVIAFSADDIQDVTWRYSAKHKELISRRHECREEWLVNTICKLRKQKWDKLPEARKKTLQLRLTSELVELLTPKMAGEGETGGRVSGSMAWRLARGEAGPSTAASQTKIGLNDQEKSQKTLHLMYCCANDMYVRPICGDQVPDWSSLVFKQENIHRKVEHDWKMVYLTRSPGTSSGSIEWKFDFSDSGLLIDSIDIRVDSEVFHTGKVHFLICSEEQCVPLRSGTRTQITDLKGTNKFSLTARLSGGDGEHAWQHAQLFRQKDSAVTDFPLDIKITLYER